MGLGEKSKIYDFAQLKRHYLLRTYRQDVLLEWFIKNPEFDVPVLGTKPDEVFDVAVTLNGKPMDKNSLIQNSRQERLRPRRGRRGGGLFGVHAGRGGRHPDNLSGRPGPVLRRYPAIGCMMVPKSSRAGRRAVPNPDRTMACNRQLGGSGHRRHLAQDLSESAEAAAQQARCYSGARHHPDILF